VKSFPTVFLVVHLLLGSPSELSKEEINMRNLESAQKIFLIATTTALEAESESYRGKLAVAYVITNIASTRRQSILKVVFKPFAFSAWNTRGGRQRSLDVISEKIWRESEKAAASAYYKIEPDPTKGATHYLNIPLTKRIRRDGKLPSWVSRLTKTVVIGRHTFFKGGR